MKRRLIILLSLVMTAVMLNTSLPFSAAKIQTAETAADFLLIGDADTDADVTIMDATAIQRKLADLRSFTEVQEYLGDVTGDGELTILDATVIQRLIAGLANDFWTKSVKPSLPAAPSCTWMSFYPTQRSGTGRDPVYAHTTVQLNVYSAYRRVGGRYVTTRYDVYVDDEPVADDTKKGYLTYRFDQAGDHTVRVIARNTFGTSDETVATVSVLDSPEKPYLADAEIDSENHRLTVQAAGGSGGYQYCFYIRLSIPEEPTECPTEGAGPQPVEPTEAPGEPPTEAATEEATFRPEPLPAGTYQLTSDYIDSPSITIPGDMLNMGMAYNFYVSIRDSAGAESELTAVYDYDLSSY